MGVCAFEQNRPTIDNMEAYGAAALLPVVVDTVLAFVGKGYSVDPLLRSWPELKRPAVEEAIRLASESLQTCYMRPAQGTEAPA